VLKHAGPSPVATVMVQWRPDSITLEVTDDGRGAAADSDGLGQGLRGMAERATMFGGTVSAGPRPGGGFRVRAQIPTAEALPTTAPMRSPVRSPMPPPMTPPIEQES
jgi:signal transduction histidine kinase